MKKIIFFLLIATVVFGQRIRPSEVKGYMLEDSTITADKIATAAVTVADTTAFPTLTDSRIGFYVWVQSLKAFYIQVDSAYNETYKGIAYNSYTQGKQWVEYEFLKNRAVNVLQFYADGDSTAGTGKKNHYAINNAFDFAYSVKTSLKISPKVFAPTGKYIVRPQIINDDESPYYHIGIEPSIAWEASPGAFFYTDSSGGILFGLSENFKTAQYDDKIIDVSGGHYIGLHRLDTSVVNTTGSGGSCLYMVKNNYRTKQVTINNVDIKGFGGLAIGAQNSDKVRITDWLVSDNDFTAINTSRSKDVIVSHGIVDNVRLLYEGFNNITYDSIGIDSTTSFLFNNNIATNIYKYVIRYTGGGFVKIKDNVFTGMLGKSFTGAGNSDDSGIWINASNTYGNTGIENILIDGNTFDGKNGALHTGVFITTADTSIGDITISNNIITGFYQNGIYQTATDSSYVGKIEIYGNTIYNNNLRAANTVGMSNIVLTNANQPSIHNNSIYYNTSSLALGKSPVYLDHCYKPSIYNNDFQDPTGTYTYTVFHKNNSLYPLVYNNKGLTLASGIGKLTLPSTYNYYYQQSFVDNKGTYQSGGLSETAVLSTMISDTLCTVYYNTSGVAVDTIRVHPTR